jgi:hypothetical protein
MCAVVKPRGRRFEVWAVVTWGWLWVHRVHFSDCSGTSMPTATAWSHACCHARAWELPSALMRFSEVLSHYTPERELSRLIGTAYTQRVGPD